MSSKTVKLLRQAVKISKKYSADDMSVYAAQASFFIIIAAFPFIMVLLSIVQLIPSISKADFLRVIVELTPNMLHSYLVTIIDDLFTKSPGTVFSISAVTALWSASKGMVSMSKGLNQICGCEKDRSFLKSRLICTAYTFVFVIACVLSLVLLVFGTSLQALIVNYFPILGKITTHIINLRGLIALALLIVIFTGFYTYLPDTHQKMRDQLPGAVFSTFCWMLFSYCFSIYFENFSNYSYMYGSLTAIVLLMLWLYFAICILFLGGEINYFYSREKN